MVGIAVSVGEAGEREGCRARRLRRVAAWSAAALLVTVLGGGSLLALAERGGMLGRGTYYPRIPSDFTMIEAALRMYWIKVGEAPTTAQGLQALVEMPADKPLPRNWMQMMTVVPKDPWGNEYGYRSPALDGSEWEILCACRDGKWGTADDLSSRDKKGGA